MEITFNSNKIDQLHEVFLSNKYGLEDSKLTTIRPSIYDNSPSVKRYLL